MGKSYKELFLELDQLDPDPVLNQRVLAKIDVAKKRAARANFMLLSLFSIASFIALVPAIQYAIQDFYKSGFYEYIFLVFSDGGIVLVSWKEFLLLLAESLPVSSAVILLSTIFIFFGSVRLTIKNMRKAFLFSNAFSN